MKSQKIATAQLSLALNNAQPGFNPENDETIMIEARSGKTRYKIKLFNLADITRKLATLHRSTRGAYARVGTGRDYPAFFPGMATCQYIFAYERLNASAHILPVDFDRIGLRPAALYENGALDFDVVEDVNEDYYSTQAAQDVAQVVADAVAAVAISETMAPSETRERMYHIEWISMKNGERKRVTRYAMNHAQCMTMISKMSPSNIVRYEVVEESRELVTCESGEGEALRTHEINASWVIKNKETGAVITETYSKKAVAALNTDKYEAVPIVDHLAGIGRPQIKPIEPDPTVTEFLEVADPPVTEFLPGKPAYSLPTESIYKDWQGYEGKDFAPSERQQIVIDAVSISLDEKLFYTKDVLARCVELLNIDAETQAIKSERVEGGDVGMDIYYARNHIEAKNAREYADKIKSEMNLRVGEVLGPLVFTDYKRTTGVTITEVSESGFTFTGKRGSQTVSGTASANQLKCGIERAFTTGKRKTDYPAFIARRIATIPQAPASQPCSEAQDVPAIDAQNLVNAGYHPTVADCIVHHGLSAYGPMAQAEILAKLEAAQPAQDAPVTQAKPTVKGKSGKWRAWLYEGMVGIYGLRFETADNTSSYTYSTARGRMNDLQAMAQEADAAMAADAPAATPPEPPVAEFLAATPPPVTEFLGEPPVAVSSEPLHPRNYIPTGGVHIVDDAFEAWKHTDSERFYFVMYLGKSAKPWKYYGYPTEAKRDDGYERHAIDARDIAARKAKRKAEAKAQADKPHGLQVGDVVRSSWGYEQTNVNHYQIVKVIGKRTVEVRELAEHDESDGCQSMTGRVTPIPDDFVGGVMRRQVDSCGAVNMLSAAYGRAYKIEPLATVHGVRCYAASSYSSYA